MRILDELLASVVYMYPDATSASAAAGAGATGFLVRYSHDGTEGVDYIVTNAHVVFSGGTSLRYNTDSGLSRIVEIPIEKWTHGRGRQDVSVALLPATEDSVHEAIDWRHFGLTETDVDEMNLGPGDEVAMLGRLSGYDGIHQIQPVARFGNIARMNGEPVRDQYGNLVDVSLVEMRSLSGFSGSPVIGFIPPGSFRRPGEPIKPGEMSIFVLGLDCGHITRSSAVVDGEGRQLQDWLVRENTGISLVVPAWEIERLLGEAVESH